MVWLSSVDTRPLLAWYDDEVGVLRAAAVAGTVLASMSQFEGIETWLLRSRYPSFYHALMDTGV